MPKHIVGLVLILTLAVFDVFPAHAAARPSLRRGDRGASVRELQSLLNTWITTTRSPLRQLPVNGVFGPQTEATVKAFQRAKRLPVTGVVASLTWQALLGTPAPRPPRRTDCDPAYPTICIPAGSYDLDCPEIPYRRFPVPGVDPHRFDGDNDGIGCER